ncbi:putative metal-binding motif-containing protein, partial [Nanoarchaeota archaeon]
MKEKLLVPGAIILLFIAGCCSTDLDKDGYGYEPAAWCPPAIDCDDTNNAIFPNAGENCNDDIDNDCDEGLRLIDCDDPDCEGDINCGLPECEDVDNDGYTTCDGDCDDTNPSINPGAVEVCNEIDDNCDGNIDDGDVDGDGYTCENDCNDHNDLVYSGSDFDDDKQLACINDCDDEDPLVFNDNPERCGDERDNDCDGAIDDGCNENQCPEGYVKCKDNVPQRCVINEGVGEYVNEGSECNTIRDCTALNFEAGGHKFGRVGCSPVPRLITSDPVTVGNKWGRITFPPRIQPENFTMTCIQIMDRYYSINTKFCKNLKLLSGEKMIVKFINSLPIVAEHSELLLDNDDKILEECLPGTCDLTGIFPEYFSYEVSHNSDGGEYYYGCNPCSGECEVGPSTKRCSVCGTNPSEEGIPCVVVNKPCEYYDQPGYKVSVVKKCHTDFYDGCDMAQGGCYKNVPTGCGPDGEDQCDKGFVQYCEDYPDSDSTLCKCDCPKDAPLCKPDKETGQKVCMTNGQYCMDKDPPEIPCGGLGDIFQPEVCCKPGIESCIQGECCLDKDQNGWCDSDEPCGDGEVVCGADESQCCPQNQACYLDGQCQCCGQNQVCDSEDGCSILDECNLECPFNCDCINNKCVRKGTCKNTGQIVLMPCDEGIDERCYDCWTHWGGCSDGDLPGCPVTCDGGYNNIKGYACSSWTSITQPGGPCGPKVCVRTQSCEDGAPCD